MLKVGADGEIRLILKVQDDGTAVVKDFSEEADKNLNKASKSVADNSKKDLGNAGVEWEKLGRRIGFVAGAAIVAIGAMGVSTLNAAGEMLALSERTGISVEKLSAWKYIADQSNSSLNALVPGLRSLAVNMQAAADGQDEQSKAFKRLNVQVTDSQGRLRDMDAVMLDLADRFSKMEDGARKTALAQQIFGRGGLELIPVLNQGRAGIAKLTEEAKRLGVVFSTEAAKAANDFKDTLNTLKTSVTGLATQLVERGAPALVRISEATRQALEDSGPLMAFWVAFGGVFAESFGLVDKSLLTTAEQIRETRKELAALESQYKGLDKDTKQLGPGKEFQRLIDAKRRELQALQEQLKLEQERLGAGGKKGSGKTDAPSDKYLEGLKAYQEMIWEQMIEVEERSAEELKALRANNGEMYDKLFKAPLPEPPLNFLGLNAGEFERQLREQQVAAEALEGRRGKQDDVAKQRAERRAELDTNYIMVRDSLRTEREVIEQDNAFKAQVLQDWLTERRSFLASEVANDRLSQEQADQLALEAQAKHYDLMKRLDEEYIQNKLSLKSQETQRLQALADGARRGELNSIASLFGEAVPLMQSKSRTLFSIGKAAAIAEAIVSTHTAIANALAVKPFPLGLALAGLAAVKGFAQVQAIRATQFGSAAATPVFSASPSTGLPESPIVPSSGGGEGGAGQAQPQFSRVERYTLVGNFFDDAFMRDTMIPMLRRAQKDGVFLEFEMRKAA